MKHLFLLNLLLLSIIFGCEKAKDGSKQIKDNDFVVIKDPELISFICSYIDSASYNRNGGFIKVDINTIGTREIFYINHERLFNLRRRKMPCFISKIDSHLIFFYSNAHQYLQPEKSNFFLQLLQKFNIPTQPNFNEMYHPDLWKITKCPSNSPIIETRKLSDLQDDYIKCY